MLVLVLIISLAAASLLQRRATETGQKSISIDGPGYYVVQFRTSITSALLRRLTSVLEYEPKDYVPDNSLLLWIDSVDRGARLLRATPQIRWIGNLQQEHRKIDFTSAIKSLNLEYERFRPLRVNGTVTVQSTADTAHELLRSPSAAFERDTGGSGAVVARLRILARDLHAPTAQDSAQSASRTRVQLTQHTNDDDNESPLDHIYELENVHVDDLSNVASALAEQHNVRWVELRTPYHTLNRWSVPSLHFAEGGDQRLFTQLPLRGRNQLISISDTGLASDTCFFSDSVPVPFTPIQRVPVDTNHRKIRAYWSGSGGDFRDQGPFAGHGTHVCGTAVGSGSGVTREFSGAAPDARLVFIDLQPASNQNGFLEIPLQIDTTLLQFSYDAGARVHSASWGGDSGGRYTSDEQAIDRFCYQNRHMIVVFAAGNSGPGSGTISSPALAKNILSVGATMNGIESVRLGQVPSRPADDYDHDWLAPFSSRGSASLPFRKPDVVAPGGSFVWSAANDGPTGSCATLAGNIVGLQGTSMATPLVAGGALLVREYFATGQYPNRAGITAVDTTSPTASLVRATLVASAQSLRGVYPRQAFTSAQQRIDAQGHGRVALDQALDYGEGTLLAVLSNEDERLAVSTKTFRRWCISIDGAYDELAVTLAYADYPSLPMARISLVNDLRLQVIDGESDIEVAINEQTGKPELRSTVERAIVRKTSSVSVAVHGDVIGFGDTQSYSLVVALRGAATSTRISISEPHSDPMCVRCTALRNLFLPNSVCPICGDGVVDAPLEECDSTTCCDTTTCRFLNDNSPCSVIAGDCRIAGKCHGANGCLIDGATIYSTKGVQANCEVVTKPPGSPPCIFLSSSTWATRLEAIGANRQLCCAPLRSAFEGIEFEHLFSLLAREYAAALMNSVQPGALIDGASLLLIERARLLLEAHCGVGFIDIEDRHTASLMHNDLRTLNEHCGDSTTVEKPNTCTAASLDDRLCSGGGVYDRQAGTCECKADRQTTEPDCAHLSCSGNGVSMVDYETQSLQCACYEGWTGADCSQCAVTASNSPLAYHCIGIPSPLVAPPKRYLALVLRSSVSARLDGSFYDGVLRKYSDTVPGESGTDCWCREANERLQWRAMPSHFDVIKAVNQQRITMLDIRARSEALFALAQEKEQPPQKCVRNSALANTGTSRSLMALFTIIAAAATVY